MTNGPYNIRPSPSELRYEIVADGANDTVAEAPLRLLLRALRGRYRLAVGLGLTLAVIGAIVGFNAKPAKYMSRGLVRIDAARSPILYNSQENKTPPMFDALVSAQEQVLQSRAILDAALARPEMRAVGWPDAPEGVAELQRALMAKRGRRENLIAVSVVHPDPAMAHVAVNAILAEFERSPGAAEGLSRMEKEQTLLARERALEQDLRDLRAEILERSGQYGADGIERMHATRVDELLSLDRRISELRGNATLEADAPIDTGDEAEQLRRREIELLATRAALRTKFRPAHPAMHEIEVHLTAVQALRRLQAGLGDETAAIEAPVDRRLERALATRSEILAELNVLGAQQVAVAALTDRSDTIGEQLHATRRRLDELQLEARAGKPNRITIAAWGERPVSPTYDHRAKLAVGGALCGVAMGIGLVFLLGLVDRRARFADELARAREGVDVIGVLPDVAELGASGPHRASSAVNQIRNLLEFRVDTHPVLAITGCARGEGRTSFAVALGTSFASAGRRTLIIDGDVTRPSLSHGFGADDGCPADLTIEALTPDGRGDLSRSTVLEVLAAARERFDTIIVDTGPVAESVEACLIAGVADRVILMVTRHQRLALVREALTRLERFGAQVAGFVFNRAGAEDIGPVTKGDHGPGAPAPFVPAFTPSENDDAGYPFPAEPERRRAA
ncbi:MAG: hypothetical protein GY715_07055 [Planctomycetes bacterium]|nr:hypothetical protein [Planctomycetota bacterium]